MSDPLHIHLSVAINPNHRFEVCREAPNDHETNVALGDFMSDVQELWIAFTGEIELIEKGNLNDE